MRAPGLRSSVTVKSPPPVSASPKVNPAVELQWNAPQLLKVAVISRRIAVELNLEQTGGKPLPLCAAGNHKRLFADKRAVCPQFISSSGPVLHTIGLLEAHSRSRCGRPVPELTPRAPVPESSSALPVGSRNSRLHYAVKARSIRATQVPVAYHPALDSVLCVPEWTVHLPNIVVELIVGVAGAFPLRPNQTPLPVVNPWSQAGLRFGYQGYSDNFPTRQTI